MRVLLPPGNIIKELELYKRELFARHGSFSSVAIPVLFPHQFALTENDFSPVSDDVLKAVRAKRKILKDRHLEEIRSREYVEYAFIPWSIPPRILFKSNDSAKLKSFFRPTSDVSE